MTALEQAMLINDPEYPEDSWFEDMDLILATGGNGFSEHDFVFYFRPVRSDWSEEQLYNLELSAPDGDAWMIWVLVGDIRRAAECANQFPRKDWIIFHRKLGGTRKWSYDRILRLAANGLQ